ncbi:MAG: ATP-dependent zinc metalloprotease FtsH [Bacteroidetes bacterium]|nr:ATP-dependent zinc metalloprotease FtsH [Bacteroidota bacterium]
MSSSKLPKKPKVNFPIQWVVLVVIGFFFVWQFYDMPGGPKEIGFSEFKKDVLEKGKIKKMVIVKLDDKFFVEAYLNDSILKLKSVEADSKISKNGPHYTFDISSPDIFVKEVEAYNAIAPANHKVSVDNDNREHSFLESISGFLLLLAVMAVFWIFMMRRMGGGGGPGGQIFNIGKSRATLFDKDAKVDITFADVAGLEEAKVEIKEIVDFLKHPKKYTELGAKIPKGALLVGPPGTGKTLLAKAVAGEAKVPFYSLSGSDFVEMFVGVGASRVRDLFKQAKEKAPCIIFIDEIDAIGRARGKNPAQGANDERENTLNQLLTEMDGFGTNSGIIVLAATNRADILDRALMRAGRFDRMIYVDMPDLNERKDIFKVHLKPIKIDSTVEVEFLAKQTPGFSGADIANICNEAALIAARTNKSTVGKQDFLDAVDRIIGGLEKKNKIITPKEKETIAYHEAGHATVSWFMRHASPLLKVTIVPRGRSLGAAWYLPEERQITTKDQIFHEMCAALGGRAAEQIVFGEISTGALSDLEKVTKQAMSMIVVYGLNEKIGNVSYYDSSGANEYALTKPYSEQTAETIDFEVRKIIEEAYTVAKNILSEHKESLGKLARLLLEKEVIFKEDLEAIFGTRPGEEVVVVEEKATVVEEKKEPEVVAEGKKVDQTVEPLTHKESESSSEKDKEENKEDKKPPLQINLDF